MTIDLAARGERVGVGHVIGAVEHARVCAVAGHAVALEIAEVLGERRGAKARAPMACDSRLDHDTTGRGAEGQPCSDRATTPEPGPAPPSACAKAWPGVPRAAGGADNLVDEALGPTTPLATIPDPARPQAELVVPAGHRPALDPTDGRLATKSLIKCREGKVLPAPVGRAAGRCSRCKSLISL